MLKTTTSEDQLRHLEHNDIVLSGELRVVGKDNLDNDVEFVLSTGELCIRRTERVGDIYSHRYFDYQPHWSVRLSYDEEFTDLQPLDKYGSVYRMKVETYEARRSVFTTINKSATLEDVTAAAQALGVPPNARITVISAKQSEEDQIQLPPNKTEIMFSWTETVPK